MHTCIPSHRLKRSWQSCPKRVSAGNKNTPSTHHPRIWNVTASMVGLKKKRSLTQKSHPKNSEPQRYSWERKRSQRPGTLQSESSCWLYDHTSLTHIQKHFDGRNWMCHCMCNCNWEHFTTFNKHQIHMKINKICLPSPFMAFLSFRTSSSALKRGYGLRVPSSCSKNSINDDW